MRRKRRPPYAGSVYPRGLRAWNPLARWLLFFAIGAALGLLCLVLTVWPASGAPYPGPVVTPSTYGPPCPNGGAAC
jgi:hypothetical protein